MKQIRILALALLMSSTLLAADGIKFQSLKWAEIKAKALKENKMIFLDAFASWCGPCKYMEENIYTNKETADYFNEHYINVKIDMEVGEGTELSEEFEVTAYPTFLFFSPEGKLVHKSVGAMEADDFIELGKIAQVPDQQYFTLLNKARAGLLDDASFLKWVEMADKLEEAEKDELVKKYVAGKKDIFANKNILSIVFYHSVKSDQVVKTILKEGQKVSSLMGWDSSTAKTEIYNMVFSHCLKSYTRHDSSVDSFMATFRKVYPAKADMAKADIKYRIALLVDKDGSKAMDVLIAGLKDPKNYVTLETASSWLIDNVDDFEKNDFAKLASSLQAYTLRQGDKGQECWLYLMQMLAAGKMGNEEKSKEFALKAYQHKNLPEVYKEALRKNYDFN